MTSRLLVLASASLALGALACFDTDTSPEEAAPPPVATPNAPTVGAVAAAPGMGDARPVAGAGGGGGGGRPGAQGLPASDVDFRVTNPVTGVELAVYADLPSSPPPYKAVVVVPGGTRDASGAFTHDKLREAITDRGVAVFRFDPDGRGNSAGDEDLGGKKQQAGLKAVIASVIARDDVADDQVGVFSNSMGILMSTGALAGNDTGARFLIDYEGSKDGWYAVGCDGSGDIHARTWPSWMDCDDEAFWKDRRATVAMSTMEIPYQRIQRKVDHVLADDASNAFALYREALEGPCPWVRLNTLDPNIATTEVEGAERPDVGFMTLYSWYPDYIEDMFLVIDGKTPPARDHVMSDGEGGGKPPRGARQGGGGRQGGGKGGKQGRPGKKAR